MTPVPDSVIEKVKKLMNFNPENASEQEVAIATSRVHEMLSKYQLTIADVENSDVGEDIKEQEVDAGVAVMRTWHYLLMGALVDNFDCTHLLHTYRGGYRGPNNKKVGWNGYRTFKIIGHESDVEMVTWLFSYLSETLKGMARKKARERGLRGGQIASYTNSFIQGASIEIKRRLHEQRNPVEQTEEVQQCQALVHVKKDKVDDKMKEWHPDLTDSKLSFSCNSGEGVRDGMEAGRNVSLNRPVGGGSSKGVLN